MDSQFRIFRLTSSLPVLDVCLLKPLKKLFAPSCLSNQLKNRPKKSLATTILVFAGFLLSKYRKEENMTVSAIPKGYSTITPYLIIRGVSKAIEFYKNAFGAIEIRRIEANGKVM